MPNKQVGGSRKGVAGSIISRIDSNGVKQRVWPPELQIPSLTRWWRSTDGITKDEFGNISSWTDRVGNTTLTQPNVANRPQVAPSNGSGAGVDGVALVGANNTALSGVVMPSINQPYTYFVVATTTTTATSGVITLAQSGQTGANPTSGPSIACDTSIGRWRAFAGGAGNAPQGTASARVRSCFIVTFSGSTSTLTVNGSRNTTSLGVRALESTFTIGKATNGASPWDGVIWEMGLFNEALSTTNINAVNRYAQERYNLTPSVVYL